MDYKLNPSPRVKTWVKRATIVLIGTTILLTGVTVFGNEPDPESSYEYALKVEQMTLETHRAAATSRCNAERELAKHKLLQHYSSELELSSSDVSRLDNKTRYTCDYSSSVFY
jgi:hypothetical protein